MKLATSCRTALSLLACEKKAGHVQPSSTVSRFYTVSGRRCSPRSWNRPPKLSIQLATTRNDFPEELHVLYSVRKSKIINSQAAWRIILYQTVCSFVMRGELASLHHALNNFPLVSLYLAHLPIASLCHLAVSSGLNCGSVKKKHGGFKPCQRLKAF